MKAETPDSQRAETSTPEKTRNFWLGELKNSVGGEFTSWEEKCRKIIDKYRVKSTAASLRDDMLSGDSARFNILWSNVELFKPSLFARNPKPDVERRHKDNDRIARIASEVLERAIQYEMDESPYAETINASLLDYLLTGRGVFRTVYEFTEGLRLDPMTGQQVQVKDYECAKHKFVHWKDYRHSQCRIPQERTWEAFRTYESRDSLIKRFGPVVGEKIPLDYSPRADKNNANDTEGGTKRAQIWEVWDKEKREVIWLSEVYPEVLDIKPDPLGLKDFFSASLVFSTTSTDSLLPIPDYTLYQTHAITLDVIQQRIVAILDAVRANGVYNAAYSQDLSNIIKQDDGKLYPINNYKDLTDKGGLQGIMEFTPIEQFVSVLNVLYDAGDREIQKIYEITGLSDVIRGASDPRETAKAQQLKGQYGNLRLSARQAAIQEWLRDGIAKKGEIICEHFDADRLRQISGYDIMPGVNPEDPSEWMQVYQTLSTELIREYRISIETDSTIATDTQAQKEAWGDYLNATSSFLQTAVGAVQVTPQLAPYFKEALLATSRAYSAGSALEDTLSTCFDSLVESLNQPPPPPPPDPSIQVAEIKAQVDREKIQSDQMRVDEQVQAKLHQAETKAQVDLQKLESKHQTDMAKIEAKVESDMHKILLEVEKLTREMEMREAELKAELLQAQLEAVTARSESDGKVREAESKSRESSASAKVPDVTVNIVKPSSFKIERDPNTGLMTEVKDSSLSAG